LEYLLVLGGMVALFGGGDMLVRGAVAVAQDFKVSPMVIGLTLVGFGTSAPELLTSLQAAFAGAPDIAIGNVVGSNIANILLILGVSALIAPVLIRRDTLMRDGGILIATTVLTIGLMAFGSIGRLAGLVLFAGLLAFLATAFLTDGEGGGDLPEPSANSSTLRAFLTFAVGLVVTLMGAKFLVQGAIVMATNLGVSEAVIGLTVVAIGTSLPELITSAMAALRGKSDVAVGNIIGSCVFNLLGILGLTALVHPLSVAPEIMAFDVWIMAAATALLVLAGMFLGRIGRGMGAAMALAYAGYIAFLAL
jgi:cation:H+ antiporter